MSHMRTQMELWGGVECTVNRVKDSYFDQLERSGHRERIRQDLELFAQIGLRTLRTAMHWECAEDSLCWERWDELSAEMNRLALHPIVGLLHHGSGPRSTDLLDPEFPERLAAFALEVARRYPHLTDYTPVNEPQTTARFSCLYGHWYPHHRDMRSYLRALVHEVKGIVLSMRAIRSVQPLARLIHTEDAGATYASDSLEEFRVQREHRRWLGLDLLCGRVTETHALFAFLVDHGVTEAEILWFVDNSCPPSVVGLNYYVTSDRFLDDRLELYPAWAGGDTGTEPLVDIEAVRVRREGITGAGGVLREAWERYGLPVAITEAHLGCDALEQTRWLAEVWREAQDARDAGVEVQAVTAWALLGSYNWSSLCTHESGSYEPGVFDLSGGAPAATALTDLIYRLAHDLPASASASAPGWWRRADRLTIPPPQADADVVLEEPTLI